jgi:RNA polymerase sigma factor (sigma-70 family)
MMTLKTMSTTARNDEELVSESLSGNRDAFGQIVSRYQSLVCSLAYSATGNLSQSEDLAQETFITAWKRLADLREPAKLRAWLCGIARNLIHNTLRRQGREPAHNAESLEEASTSHSPEPLPVDQTISREEEAILWRSIESIPEIYREPLVLFYREQQSVETVARELDLSEDAVKQRLSRGRKLLHEQVLAFVEGALQRTRPDRMFTLAVLAALPGFTLTAKAAAVGAAVKGGAAVKTAAASGIWSAILGPFLVIFGNYLGYRMQLDMARSDLERDFIKRFHRRLWACILGFGIAFTPIMLCALKYSKTHPLMITALISSVTGVYLLAIIALSIWSWRARRNILADLTTSIPQAILDKPIYEYRSPIECLGWPLVHVRTGGCSSVKRSPVKAWIAIGDSAVGGLFAFGGMAIAPISIGGLAIGLLPFGGCAVGLFAIGGLGLGIWADGGAAVGWQAYGGCALAWNAAAGGAAIARDFAVGGAAYAAQANNEIARHFIQSLVFFRAAEILEHYIVWMQLLWVLPMIWWWRVVRRARTMQ